MNLALRRIAGAFAAIAFLSASAFTLAHAGPALEHNSAAALRTAAMVATVNAEYDYAFTVDHWSMEGDKETVAKLRFDPRLPEDEQWTVLAPAEEDLGKGAKKTLKALRNGAGEVEDGETQDHPLLYNRLDEMLEVAELHQETAEEAVFVAVVDEDDFPKDTLEVFMTLNKAGGYISRIDVKAKKPFKPLPIAKVTTLVQSQVFSAPAEPGAPAFLVRNEGLVAGKAMFRSFKQESRQTFSEIERVDMLGGAPDVAGDVSE